MTPVTVSNRRALVFRCVLLVALGALCITVPAQARDRIGWLRDLGLGQGVPLVVLPPGAGAIVGVDEQRKTDSFVQTITLAGDAGTVGDNQIVVRVTRNGLAPRIDEDTVATEAQQQLPNFTFRLGPTGTRNTFGLFGALIGGKGGVNCLYAWQRVDLADPWITGEMSNALDELHAMTMRYRLCRTTASANDLLAFVQSAQSGRNGTGGVIHVSPGYDALTAAASLDPAPRSDGVIYGSAVLVEPMPLVSERRVLRRPVRSAYRSRARMEREAPAAEPSTETKLDIPDLPLP